VTAYEKAERFLIVFFLSLGARPTGRREEHFAGVDGGNVRGEDGVGEDVANKLRSRHASTL